MENNVKVKKIPVTLDRERNLVFDLNAFCELEEKFGGAKEAFTALESGSMKAIRTMLWAGLVHEDENLTEKQVGSMISVENIRDIANKIAEAISEAMPDAKN